LYAGPKSAQNILKNIIPSPTRPEKPGPTYNPAAKVKVVSFNKTNAFLYDVTPSENYILESR